MPLTVSSTSVSLHRAYDGVRTPAPATWPPTRRAPAPNRSHAPGLLEPGLPWPLLTSPRAPARHAITMAERRAEPASSPSFAPCPGCSLPSSPSLSLPPIERAHGPLARPDPISPFAARHCRRQARARRGQAVPEPHCLFGRHQNLPRLSLVLYTRSNAAGTRRSTAVPDQTHRRPPLTADPSPQTLSRRATAT